MKLKNIVITLLAIFSIISLFIYIEPSVTGFAVQNKLMIANISVSADEFDQEIKVEQYDDYEIKIDNALYYFTAEIKKEQPVNYILIEFETDNAQLGEFTKEDVSLYYYKDGWVKLETEFVREKGRYNYYKAKADRFGLFAAALRKEEKKEIIAPKVNEDEIVLFALIPIFGILILSIIFSFTFVKLIQKINYRFYLLLKKGFIGLFKFVLSSGIVFLVLGIISPEQTGAESKDIIYYALIPLFTLSILSDLILNFFLWVHRLIEYNKVYRFLRNSFWIFTASFIMIFSLLVLLVPENTGSINSAELIIYGLAPILAMSFVPIFAFYIIYLLFRRFVRA